MKKTQQPESLREITRKKVYETFKTNESSFLQKLETNTYGDTNDVKMLKAKN